jgi:hypothetical protein
MERPSFTRHDTDAVVNEDEKKPYGTTTSADHSSGEYRNSKESIGKGYTAGTTELPPYHDTEAAIGEGEIGALETAEDIVTTVIHVDDDPTINPWTFRMFFIGEFHLSHTPAGAIKC